MANVIKPKRSNTASAVPTTGQLASGELAVNMADQKVYINNGTSVVQVGAGNLTGLGDVNITSVSNNQVLKYDSATSKWINGSGGGGSGDVIGPASATDNAITRFDGTSGTLIQNSTVTLDDNGNVINVNSLGLDTTPATVPATVGTISWDDGDGVPSVLLKGGNTTLQIGTQEYARVYNDSGSTLTRGQVVYIFGAQGNRVSVKLARADVEATSYGTIGLVAESIANGAEGFIIVSGALYKLDTSALTAGATVYLSPTTAGAVTTTKPQAPNQLVVLGWVERVHATVGSIYVKIDNGYELDELHDVQINSPVSGNLLIYDATTSPIGVWKNASLTAGTAISVSNGAGSVTINNTGVTSAVAGTGISVSSATGAVTVTNTAPDQTVSLTNGGAIGISGTYPNFTLTNNGVTSVTGTTNQITASASTGSVTLSLPATINVNTTGTASNVTGTVAIANGGTGATDAGTARSNLGLAIGTNVQAYDADLAAIAALTPTADNFIVGNGTTWILETPAQSRTSLGGTTVGQNLFTLTNPSAVTFPRFNADNTVSALDAATFRTAIGAGTGSGNGTVTSVSGTGTASGLSLSGTVTTSGSLTLSGTVNSLATGSDYQVNSLSAGGSRIGEAAITVNGTTSNNDSQVIYKKPSQSSWSYLVWDGAVYLGYNIYYVNGAWVHDGPSGNNNNSLLAFQSNGARWYASNNGSGSWNVASDVALWNQSGTWVGSLNATTGAQVNSNTILHAANYNSYAPTLTGGGASGTWSINVTGSAGSASTATTATNWGSYGGVPGAGTSFGNANTIGRSDGNGYTYFGYINSSTSNSENPSISQVIVTNGSDNFYRKASIAHLTSSLSGTASINITGSAGSASTATTAGNVTGTVAIANGGTGATTAANALTNLGAYAASNPSGYISTSTFTSNRSASANGWQILPGGIYIVWGTSANVTIANNSQASVSITFPVAFPSTCYAVAMSGVEVTSPNNAVASPHIQGDPTRTGFTARFVNPNNGTNGNTMKAQYVAIGI